MVLSACKSQKEVQSRKNRKAIDRGEQEQFDDELARQEYDDALKKHHESQSEGTRNMIRKSNIRQPKVNNNFNRSWSDQLFNSSCFRRSCFVKSGHLQLQIGSTKKSNSSPFVKY